MAHTINFDEDSIAAEELELIKTKQAILEKLRVRFGDFPGNKMPARTAGEESFERSSPRAR